MYEDYITSDNDNSIEPSQNIKINALPQKTIENLKTTIKRDNEKFQIEKKKMVQVSCFHVILDLKKKIDKNPNFVKQNWS